MAPYYEKYLSAIVVFNILQSRTGQSTYYAYHSSNNIIGDFYTFFLSQIFIIIANNKYTIMTIIIILFLLVISTTTKDQNCIAGKVRNSYKYNKPPLSRKEGFPSTRCESCKLAVMAKQESKAHASNVTL